LEKHRKPIKRTIIIYSSVFIFLLSICMSVLSYSQYSQSLYKACDERMLDILDYVEAYIDHDDLYECVVTGVESDKFKEMGFFMDSIMEDFDIHYLYILRFADNKVINVFSADTAYGRETDPDGYYLGLVLDDVYSEEELHKYLVAYEKEDVSFFKNFSSWGYDYTAARRLESSGGDRVGLLCVDIEVAEIRKLIARHTAITAVLIILSGALFVAFFVFWMNRKVTDPIAKLEKSVEAFAESSHDQTDPDKLIYEDPHIHSRNEVEALSDAVSKLSNDMRDYIKKVLEEKNKVEDMKTEVIKMDMLAYQDALTHVKNKAWYDKVEARVNEDIENSKARFGIIMCDLNNLKKINDNYGHEHGNDYLAGACHLICITFDHSPVFRIGGDEFVILLERTDYNSREKLLEELKNIFNETSLDESKEPWERYSVAMGMAVYDKENDKCMNDVFKRADELMYQDKVSSKQCRE